MINDYEATSNITDPNYATREAGTAVSNDDVVSTLNNLIETCKDGQNGFQEAAEGVQNSNLKTVFYEYSQQRAQFVGELQTLVRELGGDPQTTGSIAASLHRGWIDIKSAITGKDDGAILNECERGEDSAVRNYRDALQQNLPSNVLSVVQRQAQAVQDAHDKVKALRNTANAADDASSTATGY